MQLAERCAEHLVGVGDPVRSPVSGVGAMDPDLLQLILLAEGYHGGLCILSLNMQSIKSKIVSLRHDLKHFDCGICVLSETWLTLLVAGPFSF